MKKRSAPIQESSRADRWPLFLLLGTGVCLATALLWGPTGTAPILTLLLAVEIAVFLVRLTRRRSRRVHFRLMISYALLGFLPPVLLSCLGTISLYLFLSAQEVTAVRQIVDLEVEALAKLCDELAAGFEIGAPLPPRRGAKLRWVESPGELQPREIIEGAAGEHTLVLRSPTAASGAIEASLPLDSGLLERVRQATGYRILLLSMADSESPAAPDSADRAFDLSFDKGGITLQSVSGESVRAVVSLRWSEIPIVHMVGADQLVRGPSRNVVPIIIEDSAVALAKRLAEQQRIPVREIVGFLLVAFVLAEAALMAFSMWVGHRVGKATDRLEEAARRIARGDFSTRLPDRSRDQLGALARSFNEMAHDLDRLVEDKVESERIEGEIAACATIQEGLLPPSDGTLDSLEIAAYTRPARDVGGDSYDYFSLPGGRIALVVADVAGKGVTAALYMAELKGLLMALADGRRRPAEVVRALDAALRRTLRRGSFITLAYVEIDPATGEGELVRAGHPAPLLAGPGGVREIEAEGSALGLPVIVDSVERVGRFTLARNECLVLYTDGLTEATDLDGNEMSDGPLTRAATEAATRSPGSPTAMRESLLCALEDHPGRPDDVTVLVAARVEPH
ncbi:MAG: hypothetical protein CME06_02705 [Gemmatimonadetes bacterium]|nr:hypothetical protein [Gemmatimonadota bacterium]